MLHLNGYKISNPTVLARIEHEELEQFLRGCGWTPYFVEGTDPQAMHELIAATIDKAVEAIQQIQTNARSNSDTTWPRWPMIVLKSPKGWTGPKVVDGLQIEGTFRAHQVPLLVDTEHPDHVKLLEDWMKSYKAEELFDEEGRLIPELAELAPKGDRRMGANPHANGGILLRDLQMPDFHQHAVTVSSPGAVQVEDTLILGSFLRDVAKLNQDKRNFESSGQMRRSPISCRRCLRSQTANGMRRNIAMMSSLHRLAEFWIRCSARTSARVGWKATCSLGGTAFSTVTKRSSALSTRCSASMPSG
jgi:xylulose-5-phosphate/fructose-6-phosphate phosphoketolase